MILDHDPVDVMAVRAPDDPPPTAREAAKRAGAAAPPPPPDRATPPCSDGDTRVLRTASIRTARFQQSIVTVLWVHS